ncbi:MAG: peptidase C11 [Lachnospiraceae bacterium]|nr:peptidase C11 [Lachnospiraceae bacterium]
MAVKTPRSREKFTGGASKGVHKRGEGLGTGPVGGPSGGGSSSGGMSRGAKAGGLSIPVIVIALILYFFMGGNGGSDEGTSQTQQVPDMSSVSAPTAKLDTSVAAGSRDKYTTIAGDGSDVTTLMVYMCGTDLESKSGMATNDIKEMLGAKLSDNINLLIYTGGCKKWNNSAVSSSVNQIYMVKDGKLDCLVKDDGNKSMVEADTLSSFIRWCAQNYPANRYDLIFWDHGGGSVSGFGYDEKNPKAGSMSLVGIQKALSDGGVKFDFIGFDACLMATTETALLLDRFGDYMIASEETEPGIGWYYTNWLTKYANDPSMATSEVAKNIIDDFIGACEQMVRGQKTTLSLIDLAEFSNTVPGPLSAFSKGISSTLQAKDGYKQVSDARYETREFATSSQIDQVDLVHLAQNVGTAESDTLIDAIRHAVKYNRHSSNMTNANGVSIYFPLKRSSYVEKASDTYDDIGMDASYRDCIQAFAGQQAAGQTTTPAIGQGAMSAEDIAAVFELLLGGVELTPKNLPDGRLDPADLVWIADADADTEVLYLSEEKWEQVHQLELNMYYDDGDGYINLGLDNLFEIDEKGQLLAPADRTWIAINGQPVAYYHLDTTEEGDAYTITGRVPAMLNGERVNLLLVFDNDNPRGYIAGAVYDYEDDAIETVAKSMVELNAGDRLDFLCDHYTYEGAYEDSYYLGDPMTVGEDMTISNVDVGDGPVKIIYKFTDIYNQSYWSQALDR